ncbi:MAG: hypothetical protein K9W44_10445 [Candidatus Lokiarchaeota archaeon]|nr:hypothetical protein [Candidatus Harpocratesius repetitus]
MSESTLKKELFYKIVEVLEEKISMSAYYTVELACQNINKTPEQITKEDLPNVVNAILDIYKEYYPHRVADVGNHLSMALLQKFDIKRKKRRRGFVFFKR